MTLTNALPNPTDYAIEMRFRADTLDLSTWEKLIDFQGLQTDEGAYIRGNVLQFYDEPELGTTAIFNAVDLGLLRSVFFSNDEDADFNGDGVVNFVDLGFMRTAFFAPPGPGATD